MIKNILFTIMIVLSLFGSINYAKADVIIPTITNVYFEQDGKPYNNKIEFTLNGKDYSFTLKEGETSRDISLSGFYCGAGLNIKFPIRNPSVRFSPVLYNIFFSDFLS